MTAAWAAMPSPLPGKPSFSVVVALTEIWSMETLSSSASLARMAGACGVIFGRSQMMVISAFESRPPRAAMRSAAWRKNRALSASFQLSSEGGKCRPISPSAKAP